MAAFADPIRVRQIVRNLLTNADRYGGDIEGRGRFMVELLRAMRERIGEERQEEWCCS